MSDDENAPKPGSQLTRIFPDHPLQDRRLEFEFEGFARTLAELAWNPENSTPFTVVVRGGWGRGKTTPQVWKELVVALLFLLCLLGVTPVVASDEVPLEVIRRWQEPSATEALAQGEDLSSQGQGSGRSTGTLHAVLANASDRTITAWLYTCVIAAPDGLESVISTGQDDFRLMALLEHATGGQMPPGAEPLVPGESVQVEMPVADLPSPLSGQQCAATAVVFSDNSTWGDPEALDRIFERRSRYAQDALDLLQNLRSLRRQEDLPTSLDELRARLLPGPGGSAMARPAERALASVSGSQESIPDALDDLEVEAMRLYKEVLAQLREREAARLEAVAAGILGMEMER